MNPQHTYASPSPFVYKYTHNIAKQTNPLRKVNAPQLTLTQLWNYFPFAHSHIRHHCWTIQEDLTLLKTFVTLKVKSRAKMSIIDELFPNRSTSALPKRLNLIVTNLRDAFMEYKHQNANDIIEQYMAYLDQEGFDLDRIVAETLKINKTYEILQEYIGSANAGNQQESVQSKNKKKKFSQRRQEVQNIQQPELSPEKNKQVDQIKREQDQTENNQIQNQPEVEPDRPQASVDEIYDNMKKSVSNIMNLIQLAEKMLKHRQFSNIKSQQSGE